MNIKRISAVIAVCIIVSMLAAAVSVTAAEPASNSYVALGDSIAYGYGLSDIWKQSYVNLVAAELRINLVNYAVNGMTSIGLLNALDKMNEDDDAHTQLQNASLITVSIGSNDLLSKLSGVLYTLPDSADAAAFAVLEASLTSEQKLAEFDSGVESYRINLPLIYTSLRKLNPTAQIIMTEFYNPFYGIMFGAFDFGALSDQYIVQMNDILHAGQAEMDYKIAAVYDSFNAPGRTNVDLISFNMDPHPNTDGHAIIADAVLSIVNYDALPAAAPVTETIESAETTENGNSIEITAPPETTMQSEVTSAGNNTDNQKSIIGAVILTVAAVAVFAVTGVIISKRNKQNK
ncbi:MAG: GDSL-type esterase/lipase family protein [Eubacteriales bacterium]